MPLSTLPNGMVLETQNDAETDGPRPRHLRRHLVGLMGMRLVYARC